jgi:hypothetical protein
VITVKEIMSTIPGTERLMHLTPEEVTTVEERAVKEIDCPYCSSRKGEPCRVVLYGQAREGARLPGFAHVMRRSRLCQNDIDMEDVFGPTNYKPPKVAEKKSNDVDDLLG